MKKPSFATTPGGQRGQLIRQFEDTTRGTNAPNIAAALHVLCPNPQWAGRNKAMMAGNYADIEVNKPGSIDLERAVRMAQMHALGLADWAQTP